MKRRDRLVEGQNKLIKNAGTCKENGEKERKAQAHTTRLWLSMTGFWGIEKESNVAILSASHCISACAT